MPRGNDKHMLERIGQRSCKKKKKERKATACSQEPPIHVENILNCQIPASNTYAVCATMLGLGEKEGLMYVGLVRQRDRVAFARALASAKGRKKD